MSENRLTYRIGNKVYLKNGLDGKWETMDRYDVIQNAVKKLADYEDQGDFLEVSMDNMKGIIEQRDRYASQAIAYLGLIQQLRGEFLPNRDGEEMKPEEIVNEILEKYSPSRKKRWWRRKKCMLKK